MIKLTEDIVVGGEIQCNVVSSDEAASYICGTVSTFEERWVFSCDYLVDPFIPADIETRDEVEVYLDFTYSFELLP